MSRLTILSKASSHSTSLGPNFKARYLFSGNTSVPKNLRRPFGKSKYITGFFVSSCASEPCRSSQNLISLLLKGIKKSRYPSSQHVKLALQP